MTHRLVRKVAFTGSTAVGKKIMAGCADQVKPVTLEVAVKGVKVLDPSDEASGMGPLISAQQRDVVRGFVDETEVAYTGSTPGGAGFWMPPTVVLASSTEQRVWREEVFGPVVAVMPFADEAEAEAVQMANDTEYGLAGSVYTRDVGPRTAGLAWHRGRQPQRQHARLGPLLDTVRWLQAIGTRPRARPRRPHPEICDLARRFSRENPTQGHKSGRMMRGTAPWQDVSRTGWPWSPGAPRASVWRPYAGSTKRVPGS